MLKISVRNVLKGSVKNVKLGTVNLEITIELPGGAQIVSIITKKSASGTYAFPKVKECMRNSRQVM
jgi:molybdopterin-binding protein